MKNPSRQERLGFWQGEHCTTVAPQYKELPALYRQWVTAVKLNQFIGRYAQGFGQPPQRIVADGLASTATLQPAHMHFGQTSSLGQLLLRQAPRPPQGSEAGAEGCGLS